MSPPLLTLKTIKCLPKTINEPELKVRGEVWSMRLEWKLSSEVLV